MSRVAIQIALYFSSKELRIVLDSLQSQTFRDWELYCYENSCDKEEEAKVRDILQESAIKHHLIVGKRNLGFSSHNYLFAIQQADYTLVLNDDAYLAPDFLEKMVGRLDAQPEAGSAVGLVYRWTEPEPESETDETIIDTAGLEYRALGHVIDRWAGKSRKAIADQLTEACQIMGVSGAVALYRRTAVLDASPDQTLYDPSFFMYKEDVDLAIRLKRKGYSAWFEPQAVSFHRRSIKADKQGVFARLANERRRPKQLRRIMFRNQWMIYVYHLSFALGAKDLFHTCLHEFGRGMFTFIASPSVWFSAWLSILPDLGRGFARRQQLKKLGLKKIKLLV